MPVDWLAAGLYIGGCGWFFSVQTGIATGKGCSMRASRLHGFTLVELLVVIVIIGMLAGLALGGLSAARESARKAKTKSTIAKIDSIIMAKYESYLTRRLPVTSSDMQKIAALYPNTPKTVARVMANARRDLIRMEMPDRWNDVANADGSSRAPLLAQQVASVSGGTAVWPQSAAMLRYYGQFHRSLVDLGKPREDVETYGPAECLYCIVMSTPDGPSQFNDSEIGDADGDGLKEFHDGWGRPIMWIRWPAGYLTANKANTDMQSGNDVDAFDQHQSLPVHYALVPLILSAGPDGDYDVSFGMRQDESQASGDVYLKYTLTANGDLDPYLATPISDEPNAPTAQVGTPIDSKLDGEGWHDNITNHNLTSR